MITGSGYINEVHNQNAIPINPIYAVDANNGPDIERFWKIEFIGIQEQPNAEDNEKALGQFKESISKHNGRYQTEKEVLHQYDKTIWDQLQSDIIEEVKPEMDQR
ncbi:unnamed protein product, partial [Acanthocheilonema viteae]